MFHGECVCRKGGFSVSMRIYNDISGDFFEYRRESIDYIKLGKKYDYSPLDAKYYIKKFKRNEEVVFEIESPDDDYGGEKYGEDNEEQVKVSLGCDTKMYYIKIQSSKKTSSKCTFPINKKNRTEIIKFINEYKEAYDLIENKIDEILAKHRLYIKKLYKLGI